MKESRDSNKEKCYLSQLLFMILVETLTLKIHLLLNLMIEYSSAISQELNKIYREWVIVIKMQSNRAMESAKITIAKISMKSSKK